MVDEYIHKADAVSIAESYEVKRDGFHLNDYEYGRNQVADSIASDLEDMPLADVVPVRHGKWTHKPDVYGVVYCSECNYELHANSTSFCPNCGARMDGGKED